MQEFKDIHEQLAVHAFHRIIGVSSLPDPVFRSEGKEFVSFSSNNYLSLATSGRLVNAAKKALDAYGVGNCESRLLGGDLEVYRTLEAKLARMKKKEDAILFATGYLTNVGVLAALVNSSKFARIYGYRPRKNYKYQYFTDEFNHISIREGIRASGADKVTYRHCDMNHLEDKLKASDADVKIIVSDGVFSQDGDIVPLPHLMQLAERYNAVAYIDDAHGTGVLGATGGGTTEHFNMNHPLIICMGTLSKAYGAIGGFVAADRYLIDILRYTSTAYGFTCPPPPDQAAAICEAMDIVVDEPERRQRLWANQKYFISEIDKLGFEVMARETCIVPVMIGDEELCENYSQVLNASGFHVDSILFPAVPRGQGRLRFMMNANHTREQIDRLLAVMKDIKANEVHPEFRR